MHKCNNIIITILKFITDFLEQDLSKRYWKIVHSNTIPSSIWMSVIQLYSSLRYFCILCNFKYEHEKCVYMDRNCEQILRDSYFNIFKALEFCRSNICRYQLWGGNVRLFHFANMETINATVLKIKVITVFFLIVYFLGK